jgi:hypothetical protein
MKKIFLILCAVAMVGFMASGALALTITNSTTVVGSDNLSYTAPNTIGLTSYFLIKKLDYTSTNHVMTFTTNWHPNKNGYLGVTTGDLFIDANGDGDWTDTGDFSVGLDFITTVETGTPKGSNRQGNVYTGAIQNSFIVGSGIFGKTVGGNLIPVLRGSDTGDVNVVWTLGTGSLDNTVSITLGNLVGDNFKFIWSPSTCANGPMEGTVPLPGAVLLLGAGMVRLVAYARRRQED